MKKVIVYIAFILSILALIKSPNAKATASSLEFVLLSTEEALLFLDNIRLEVFDDEPEKYIIGGFDVNDDGSYALNAEYDNLICVYNANGDFCTDTTSKIRVIMRLFGKKEMLVFIS